MRPIDADALVSWLDIVPLENGLIDPDKIKQYISEMPDANGGWVSVKDGSPPEYSECIVFADGYSQPAQYLDDGKFYTPDRYEEEKIYGVTHWMSYPEGPK
jgi:hypothetical protein